MDTKTGVKNLLFFNVTMKLLCNGIKLGFPKIWPIYIYMGLSRCIYMGLSR